MTPFFLQIADYFQNYFARDIAAFLQMYTVYITEENEGRNLRF